MSLLFDARLTRGAFTLDVSFALPEGAGTTALVGPSGAGKSTILALIAGTATPDAGKISLDDRILADTARNIFIPIHKRAIGLVHQDGLLFPHMSVRRNLLYGARRGRHPPSLDAVVSALQLAHLLERSPSTLSGGERQRVAIGRAILAKPDCLLLDEPVSALDESLRQETLRFIQTVRQLFQIPMILVTHALSEARMLADYVLLIDRGAIRAEGDPAQVLPDVLRGIVLRHAESRSLVRFGAETVWLPRIRAPIGAAVTLTPSDRHGESGGAQSADQVPFRSC